MKRDAAASGGTLVQGTLDMLLLRVLALEPMHGYGVTQRIQDISRGTLYRKIGVYALAPEGRKIGKPANEEDTNT